MSCSAEGNTEFYALNPLGPCPAQLNAAIFLKMLKRLNILTTWVLCFVKHKIPPGLNVILAAISMLNKLHWNQVHRYFVQDGI